MAFEGHLFELEGVVFPMKFIAIETYESTPNQKIDIDSYTDANGKLHRNVLPHTRSKFEFTTPTMSLTEKIEMQGFFPDRLTVSARYWNDETNTYTNGTFYVPDITFKPYATYAGDIKYKPIRIAFIEY
jgi:hypothetical protein